MNIEYNTRYRSITTINVKLLIKALLKRERRTDIVKIKQEN